ncbi:hypothetical protein ACS0TY_014009 [Phlomoides rotata]
MPFERQFFVTPLESARLPARWFLWRVRGKCLMAYIPEWKRGCFHRQWFPKRVLLQVNCWQIHCQSKAPQAARTICTGFEKCFICAKNQAFKVIRRCYSGFLGTVHWYGTVDLKSMRV